MCNRLNSFTFVSPELSLLYIVPLNKQSIYPICRPTEWSAILLDPNTFPLCALYSSHLQERTFLCHLNGFTTSDSFLPKSPQNSHSLWRSFIWRLSLLNQEMFLDWELLESTIHLFHTNDPEFSGPLLSFIHLRWWTVSLLTHQKQLQLTQEVLHWDHHWHLIFSSYFLTDLAFIPCNFVICLTWEFCDSLLLQHLWLISGWGPWHMTWITRFEVGHLRGYFIHWGKR